MTNQIISGNHQFHPEHTSETKTNSFGYAHSSNQGESGTKGTII